MRKLVPTSLLSALLSLPAVSHAQVYLGAAVGAGGAKVPAGSYAAEKATVSWTGLAATYRF